VTASSTDVSSTAGVPSSSPASSATQTSPAPTTSAATSSAPAGSGCPTSQLSLSVGDAQGAAGSTYEHYLLVNSGAVPCTLTGFPGVSFVNSAGATITTAARASTAYATITLPPGQTASFMVHTSNLGTDAGCNAATQTTTSLKIIPPNQTTSLSVASTQAACQPIVGPVQLGTQATP
jgi:hypothetical protein